MKKMYWLLCITYKRRKGQPREPIALCTGGALQMLFLHQALAKRFKVPQSWIDFKLYTAAKEVRKLAPYLYGEFVKQKSKEVA